MKCTYEITDGKLMLVFEQILFPLTLSLAVPVSFEWIQENEYAELRFCQNN